MVQYRSFRHHHRGDDDSRRNNSTGYTYVESTDYRCLIRAMVAIDTHMAADRAGGKKKERKKKVQMEHENGWANVHNKEQRD